MTQSPHNLLTIYHKPNCSKSKEACGLIKTYGIPFTIREYIIDPLNEKELKALLKKLKLKAEQIVRTKEPLYKEKYLDKKISESQWIKILAKNPILIERPIFELGNKAVIGRPPENIKQLIKI